MWWLILRLCTAVSVRDHLSAERICGLGRSPSKRARITNDVAFLAELAPTRPIHGGTCVVSPAVDARQGLTIERTRILRFLEAARKAGVVDRALVVAHDTRPELDGDYCTRLAEAIRSQLGIQTSVAGGEPGSRLRDAYSQASVVLTARLHGLIIGALLNRPVVYLGEVEEKLAPFAERFGFPCLPRDGVPGAAALEQVLSTASRLDRATLAREVAAARVEARANFVDSGGSQDLLIRR